MHRSSKPVSPHILGLKGCRCGAPAHLIGSHLRVPSSWVTRTPTLLRPAPVHAKGGVSRKPSLAAVRISLYWESKGECKPAANAALALREDHNGPVAQQNRPVALG